MLSVSTLLKKAPLIKNLNRGLKQTYERGFERQRQADIESIPTFVIQPEHCQNAKLLANRQALLKALPKGGVVAELGADQGDFSERILDLSRPKQLHIVDIWGSDRYGQDKAQAVAARFRADIDAGRVVITRALSIDAARQFEDDGFDWVYIDTDHSYKTTLAELYAYAPKVKLGGYLAGHDYRMGNWRTGYKYGVIEAVAEFCVKENWKIEYLTADFAEISSFALTRL